MISRSLAVGVVMAVVGAWAAAAWAADAQPAPAAGRESVSVIFDTDMGNDVDDCMSLALLHALQSRGECRILACTLTKSDPLAGPFVDAVNTFYGRGDIPIGVRKDPDKTGGSKFFPLVKQMDDGKLRYPSKLDHATAPEAKQLLRKTLAGQPDGSVVIVQVGFFSNLAGLLDMPGDDISPMSGKDLIKAKVKLLSIMAGSFQTIDHNNHYLEYNVVNDIPAAQKLAKDWPTPIVWSGFEIGIALAYPAVSIQRDFAYVPHHIVAEAYCLYSPPPHNRPTWDLTAALYVVRPDRDYFGLSWAGRVTVDNDGFTRFTPDGKGRDRFLTLTPIQQARTREALVQLVSEPPKAAVR
jgi:inosine-uridine nucleoside N-ribohydrolase